MTSSIWHALGRPKVRIGAVAAVSASGVLAATLIATPAAAAPPTSATAGRGRLVYAVENGRTVVHALGARLDPHPRAAHSKAQAIGTAAAVPGSYSLAKYAAAPGNQGQVNSCVAWAIDYTALNILETEQGIKGHPMAPMYTYAQIAKGRNTGTYEAQHFNILTSQGIDTRADYRQGDFDYTSQPDAHERANAAHWRLSGYTSLDTGPAAVAAVEQAISSGLPVAGMLTVHKSFSKITPAAARAYTYRPGPTSSDPVIGNHEVTIIGYNSQGVRIENSWGTGWADGGYINVSWAFVSQQLLTLNAVGKLVKH